MAKKIMGAVLLVVALCVVAYPLVSDYLSQQKKNEIIVNHTNAAATATPEERAAAWATAEAFNQALHSGKEVSRAEYEGALSLKGDGIMGVLEIPCINVKLPIYHGTAESVLQKGVGHLYGTSLPTGKNGTHVALSGHSGMAGQRMLTDLTAMSKGDTFKLYILNQVLTYKVDSIKTVLPYETGHLLSEADTERVTLITCVPYGVNSHRLLVSGVRVADAELESDTEDETAPSHKPTAKLSNWKAMYYKGLAVGGGVAAVIVTAWVILRKRSKKK